MLSLATQNRIGSTQLDHPVFHCFLLIATTAHPTWGQVQSVSLPSSDLSYISFVASPSPLGADPWSCFPLVRPTATVRYNAPAMQELTQN